MAAIKIDEILARCMRDKELSTLLAVDEDDTLTELRERVLDDIVAFDGVMAFTDGVVLTRGQVRDHLRFYDLICSLIVNGVQENRERERQIANGIWQQLQEENAYQREQGRIFRQAVPPCAFAEHFWFHHVAYVNRRVAYLFERQAAFAAAAPRITIKTLIIPGDQTKEGTLVKGVSALWFEILRRIRDDPDSIHQIDCWKWEELLAGAYKQDGWETVVLTPKRGDHGIDVIARDLGRLCFLQFDQMKKYKPDLLIGPDVIQQMEGVLLRHPEASKLMVTTTADFTTGARREAQALFPRLELRPRDKLLTWLASVAVEDLRASETSEAKGPPNA
jgi:restriction system protein